MFGKIKSKTGGNKQDKNIWKCVSKSDPKQAPLVVIWGVFENHNLKIYIFFFFLNLKLLLLFTSPNIYNKLKFK